MKTVEIVNTVNGYFVTRRYCGMNKGRQFFTKHAPADMSVRKAKKYLEEVEQAKANYINEWVGE